MVMHERRIAELLLQVRDLEAKLAVLREGALLCRNADKFSAGLLAMGLIETVLKETEAKPETTAAERYEAWEAEQDDRDWGPDPMDYEVAVTE